MANIPNAEMMNFPHWNIKKNPKFPQIMKISLDQSLIQHVDKFYKWTNCTESQLNSATRYFNSEFGLSHLDSVVAF